MLFQKGQGSVLQISPFLLNISSVSSSQHVLAKRLARSVGVGVGGVAPKLNTLTVTRNRQVYIDKCIPEGQKICDCFSIVVGVVVVV